MRIEFEQRRFKRILNGKLHIDLEETSLVRSVLWALYVAFPME